MAKDTNSNKPNERRKIRESYRRRQGFSGAIMVRVRELETDEEVPEGAELVEDPTVTPHDWRMAELDKG